MRVPYVRGAAAQLRHGATEAPAVLRGFSGRGLRRRVARGDFAEREILAWRPYGFGSRMGELLNAWRVATALGARFVFHWPPEPLFDVDEVEAVFDPDFIAAHHLPTLDIEQFGYLSTTIEPSDLRRLAAGMDRGARMAERYEVVMKARELDLPSFQEAFSAVAFHARLERIRTAVVEGPPIGIAIHVRRWDLSRPESRFGGAVSPKQMPVALIERVVEQFRHEEAGEVLLLGNDPAFVRHLATDLGARTAADLIPLVSGSPQGDAFRDFCLLARAQSVLGGESAFARVAQLVAGSRVIRPEEAISAEETRRLLWSSAVEPDPVRPLEATLASDHLFQRRDLILTASEEIALLERTLEVDPDDPTRWLGLIIRLVRVGDSDGASRVMRAMETRFRGRELLAVGQAFRGRTPPRHPAHLTDADWRELLEVEELADIWTQAMRTVSG
jgi:hypothetical protein